jgi:hypothetical protein
VFQAGVGVPGSVGIAAGRSGVDEGVVPSVRVFSEGVAVSAGVVVSVSVAVWATVGIPPRLGDSRSKEVSLTVWSSLVKNEKRGESIC